MSNSTSSPRARAASTSSVERRDSSIPFLGTRWETCSRTSLAVATRIASADRVGCALVTAPRVGRVETAAAGEHAAERGDLVLGRARLLRVLEAGRVAPGALGERLLEQRLHLGQLGRVGRAVGEADGRQPQLAVRDEAEHVHRRPRRLEAVEVAAGAPPLDRHLLAVAVDRLAGQVGVAGSGSSRSRSCRPPRA